MYKYTMKIDGTEYKAIFFDHFEAGDFIDVNEKEDGAVITDVDYKAVAPYHVFHDKDFEEAYKIEILGQFYLPNCREFDKVWKIEAELNRLGILEKLA